MPEIELRHNYADPVWIEAIMVFPENEELRNSHYAMTCAEHELKDVKPSGVVELEAGLLAAILFSPGREAIRRQAREGTKQGYVAGDYLLTLYAMYSFPSHFSEPSTRKAIFAALQYANKTSYGDGTSLPTSETTIRKYINNARSVAHLWAAMRLHEVFPIRGKKDILATPDAVQDFLGIAGTLQDFGCWFIPDRPKDGTSVLVDDEIWSVPKSSKRLAPPWKGPPPWLIKAMDAYQA